MLIYAIRSIGNQHQSSHWSDYIFVIFLYWFIWEGCWWFVRNLVSSLINWTQIWIVNTKGGIQEYMTKSFVVKLENLSTNVMNWRYNNSKLHVNLIHSRRTTRFLPTGNCRPVWPYNKPKIKSKLWETCFTHET